MITAVDTSVLIDILAADPQYLERAKKALTKCLLEGKVVACPIVWAELRPLFDSRSQMVSAMEKMAVDFDSLDEGIAMNAGETWKTYRAKGGPRNRIISDFIIGAHATARASRLLTRDRGFYRSYFKELLVIEP